MRDKLPKKALVYESGIVNLDNDSGPGTHWVAYKKRGLLVTYFDSYGDLRPPMELIKYFRGSKITYNYDRKQKFNSFNCGHLCLNFLYNDYM